MLETARPKLILFRGRKNDLYDDIAAFSSEINRLLSMAPEEQETPVSRYMISLFNLAVQKIAEKDSYCEKYLVPESVCIYWTELALASRALQAYLKEKYRS